MFRWHPTRLVSARTRTEHAISRYTLSRNPSCWRKIALRTFTDASRIYNPSNLDIPLRIPEHDIYISTSTDPFFNLTLEDWLFRHSPSSSPLLLIYRDSPCVIIGRNQNPWTEVNFPALRAARIPFIRRRSGGGTVYHDLGNTNFSIHLPRTSFDRHATGRLVLRAVQSLRVDARHVSGSAYKIVNKRAYHHGTMLLSTSLDRLGNVLHPEEKNMVTKGVSSVRSPVCNLNQFNATITHESFTSAVVEEFRQEYQINTKCYVVNDSDGAKDIEYIRRGMSELSTWSWAFGQTPEFTHTLSRSFSWGDVIAEIRSKHGIILDCSLQLTNARITSTAFESLTQWARTFYEGKRYGFLYETRDANPPGDPQLPRYERSQPILDVKGWLEDATEVSPQLR